MLNQFRTHIWCHIGHSLGAIPLAIPSQLHRSDHIQNQFLGHLGLTDTEASVTYKFTPLLVRRAIGMLGFLTNARLDCHTQV